MTLFRLALVPVLVASLASCGDDSPEAGEGAAQQLDGRTFVVTDLDGAPGDAHEIVPGSAIRIGFSAGRIDVQAGCNAMGGEVSVVDGRLVVEALSSTEMACEPPLMDQDAWVGEFLLDRPAVDISGPALTLAVGEAVLHLEEEVVADIPLEGTRWRLESLLDGGGADGSVSSPPRRAEGATLRIDDGTLVVDTGCNSGSGRVEHDDEQLRVEELAFSQRGCGGRLADLEQRYLDVLTPPTAYELEGGTLTLWSADGRQGLGFRAG